MPPESSPLAIRRHGLQVDGLRDLVQQAVSAADAVVAAAAAPWRGLARARGLSEEIDPRGGKVLRGSVAGMQVEVRRRLRDDGHSLVVTAWPAAPLPRGLFVRVAEESAPAAGIRTGDPIVDRLLVVRADDAAAAVRAAADLAAAVSDMAR